MSSAALLTDIHSASDEILATEVYRFTENRRRWAVPAETSHFLRAIFLP